MLHWCQNSWKDWVREYLLFIASERVPNVHIINFNFQINVVILLSEFLITNNKAEPSRVRLPKLEIPKFSGDALQWKRFWDQYNATIYSSTVISNIEKLNDFKKLSTRSA